MPLPTDTHIRHIPFTDPRLGRHVVHDPRSRAFARLGTPVDSSTWVTHTIRVYDPHPNPAQTVGNCTNVSEAVQLNSVGNRKAGQVFTMEQALAWYRIGTRMDPFEGAWEPDDTGSYGLAAWKAARSTGHAGAARWLFGGPDEVAQTVTVDKRAVSVGTRWDNRMFDRDSNGQVHLGGGVAGGHQWTIIGFNIDTGLFDAVCWWGPGWRRFKISHPDLGELLDDDGDVHVTDIAA